MKELDAIASRLRGGTTLADLLDAGFDAFEVIRLVARAGEDLTPELFAAFVTAAGTAVEGRNALYDAPSLPPATGPPPTITMSATVGVGQIADALAALAALLARRLADAGAQAVGEGDRAACQHATCAAADIHRLLARADAALRTGGTLATGYDGLEAAQRNELRAAAHQVSTARQARAWQQSLSPGTRDLAEDLAHGRDAPTRHAPGSWRPAGQALSIAAEFEALSWPENASSTTRETGPRQVNPGDVARLRGMRAHLKTIDNAHGGGAALPMATWVPARRDSSAA